MKSTVEIVYQDSDLVVVNKPPNYLSIPDRYAAQLPNVLGFLRTKFEEGDGVTFPPKISVVPKYALFISEFPM
jgi:23S rRNA-/tRNA-specific pseudouridylate synthase